MSNLPESLKRRGWPSSFESAGFEMNVEGDEEVRKFGDMQREFQI